MTATVKASEVQPEIQQDSSLQVKAINIGINIGSSCIVLLYYIYIFIKKIPFIVVLLFPLVSGL